MNDAQQRALTELKDYYRKRRMEAEAYHEDEKGVWVKVTLPDGQPGAEHLITEDGVIEQAPQGFQP